MPDEEILEEEILEEEMFEEETPEEETPEEETPEEETPEEEPLVIETKGRWENFEEITQTTFEIGKTYNIKVEGSCQFMVSDKKPKIGLRTNEIDYTKDETNLLWIKTR